MNYEQKNCLFFLTIFISLSVKSQEENAFVSFDVPAQNLLKFNTYLINPTFSAIAETTSYISLHHRNQWIRFDGSPEIYLLNYTNTFNDKAGVAIGIYGQKLGIISNFGVVANYAYSVNLTEKNKLTLGFNVAYFNSGLNNGEVFLGIPDPVLQNLENSSLLSFQPGLNISFGKFDVGFYAENLFDYNLKSQQTLSNFSQKTFSGHVMYTSALKKTKNLLENSSLVSMLRIRKQGTRNISFTGSLLVDIPKIGWFQTGYDTFYGAAVGVGFNINKSLALGYTFEKGFGDTEPFGVTHEISFTYAFKKKETITVTKNRIVYDTITIKKIDTIKTEIDTKELDSIKKALQKNNRLIDSLIKKQDSLENIQKTITEESKKSALENTNIDKKQQKRNTIKPQIIRNIQHVKNGYYIIANVFREEKNLKNYLNELKNREIPASYFNNPQNKLNYVYLKYLNTWDEAVISYKKTRKTTYFKDVWIIKIENR